MKIALIQMRAGNNKAENVAQALRLVGMAVEQKAQWILLPEVFNYRGRVDPAARKLIAESLPGESSRPFMELARRRRVHILLGSLYEKARGSSKVYNSSVLINPDGHIEAVYRKRNLFSARIGRTALNEAKHFLAGRRSVTARVKNFKIGLSICYDLRFSELYRRYAGQGCHIITVPSAFTDKTGSAHWEILLRARAIETQCFILAPNQYGLDAKGVKTYGHSMIISPWGEVLAAAPGQKTAIIYTQLDKEQIKIARAILPAVRAKRAT